MGRLNYFLGFALVLCIALWMEQPKADTIGDWEITKEVRGDNGEHTTTTATVDGETRGSNLNIFRMDNGDSKSMALLFTIQGMSCIDKEIYSAMVNMSTGVTPVELECRTRPAAIEQGLYLYAIWDKKIVAEILGSLEYSDDRVSLILPTGHDVRIERFKAHGSRKMLQTVFPEYF